MMTYYYDFRSVVILGLIIKYQVQYIIKKNIYIFEIVSNPLHTVIQLDSIILFLRVLQFFLKLDPTLLL